MKDKHIFMVEDEQDIVELVSFNLKQEGFEFSSINSGEYAVREVKIKKPDLILLDLMIPHSDGFEICRQLKADASTKHIPVIILSAKAQEHSIITGLEIGAEDYITKPFKLGELVARIRTVLRRKKNDVDEKLETAVGPIKMLHKEHQVYVEDDPVQLNITEYKILEHLLRNVDWVFTRNQLIDAAKGENYYITDRSVDVTMVSLRKKLLTASGQIETIRGVGYRLKSK